MRKTMAEIMRGVDNVKPGSSRRVANNTARYETTDGWTHWRLHRTTIVSKSPDGSRFILNSGGWQTLTTRDRINAYAPVRLYQRKHEWFLCARGANGSFDWHAPGIKFKDGMIVDARGVPVEQ